MLLPKIWIICRVCLKQQEEMFNIFEDLVIKSVWTILRDCGGVPVRKDDDLPDKICDTCLKQLWKANSFRMDCQRGHRELVQMVMERKFNYYEMILEEEKKCCSEIISISDSNNDFVKSINTSRSEIQIVTTRQSDKPQNAQLKDIVNENKRTDENGTGKRDNKEYCVVTRNKKKLEKEIPEEPKITSKKEPIVLLLKLKNMPNNINPSPIKTKDAVEVEPKPRRTTKNQNFERKIQSKADLKLLDENKLQTKKSISENVKSKTRTLSKELKSESKKKRIRESAKFSCKVCKKKCGTQVLLRHHMYVHNRPHQCKICKKRFSQIQAYLSHNNLHTGIKPYYCRFCYRTFSDISNRNSHERKDHANKKYKCEKCNKIFRFSSLLQKHLQGHRPKKCYICNIEFASLQMVRYHHQNVHLKALNDKN